MKTVAPFTELIDNGSRWHMSKLKRVERPPEEPDFVPDDDDMSRLATSYQLLLVVPLRLLTTTVVMVVNVIVPSLACFDDLHVSARYQLGTETVMSRDAFEGGGDVVDACTLG